MNCELESDESLDSKHHMQQTLFKILYVLKEKQSYLLPQVCE